MTSLRPISPTARPPAELPATTFRRLHFERLAVTGTVQQARSEVMKRRARAELFVLRVILAGLAVVAIGALAAPRWLR